LERFRLRDRAVPATTVVSELVVFASLRVKASVSGVDLGLGVLGDESVDHVVPLNDIAVRPHGVSAGHGNVSAAVVHLDLGCVVANKGLVIDRGDNLPTVAKAASHTSVETLAGGRNLDVPTEPADVLDRDGVDRAGLGVADVIPVDECDPVFQPVGTLGRKDNTEVKAAAFDVFRDTDVCVTEIEFDPAAGSLAISLWAIFLVERCRGVRIAAVCSVVRAPLPDSSDLCTSVFGVSVVSLSVARRTVENAPPVSSSVSVLSVRAFLTPSYASEILRSNESAVASATLPTDGLSSWVRTRLQTSEPRFVTGHHLRVPRRQLVLEV